MKPILLVVWPLHLDFPMFRYNLARFGKYFASVWIALSNHYQEVDYSNFIRAVLPQAYFVEVKHTNSDWRDDAINETLDLIKTNEPICFIEQDFFMREGFFDKVFKDDHDFIYFTEGDRIHPAFAVVKRELIEKTHRNFSAQPEKDHFGYFFDELPPGTHIDELGVENKKDYYHMAGLSQNYMSFKYGEPLYRPVQFLYYNWHCLNLEIKNQPQFFQIEKAIENKLGHPKEHEFLNNLFPEI